MTKTIGIAGGTGFVGSYLTNLLISKGYETVILTRGARVDGKPHKSYSRWDAKAGIADSNMLSGLDAVVNLAGAGIADKKWTEKRKKEIVESRVNATGFLVEKLKTYAPDCKVFISASAIGFYGPDREGGAFTEAAPPGTDFLGSTCYQWEQAAEKAGEFARTVILRFGVIMGRENGAFPKFSAPQSFGIMPVLGTGRQVMSWIEVGDLCRLILFALEHGSVSGIYNAVSPSPVTQRKLMTTIAREKGGIKIPVPVPSFLLRLLLGEMSNELLKSCTASAQKIMGAGFTFHHPGITGTVKAILGGE